MDQLRRLFASLSARQRVTIVMAAVLVGAALFAFAHWRRESDFRPLYTALAAEDAGAVVQKLKEGGIEYRLSESGTAVLVPSARLAEIRLQLAAAGLPKSGRIGFELFDKTTFGATEFVEHVNYRRALEGELERSVMSLAEVEHARVHITFPKDSAFLEARQPAKASVMVRLRPGARLAPQNVLAISHLVSSAVEGLAPEAVSVLDMRGNLLARPRKPSPDGGAELSQDLLEIQQKIERDLVAKIHSTLEPLLGAERFRASVSVECDFTSAEQSEESYDPSKSVMLTSQTSEDASGAGAATAGVPGTASNLPRPTSRPAGEQTPGVLRRTENITYQSSRVVRQTRIPQGTVKRMSAAVLVDQEVRWEGAGKERKRVVVPPAPETMKTIRELVAGATGLKTERGDQLIVESLPFESTLNVEPPLSLPPPAAPTYFLSPYVENLTRNPVLVVGITAGTTVLLLLVRVVAWLLTRWKRKRAGVHLAQQPVLEAGAASAPKQVAAEPGEAPPAATGADQKLLEPEGPDRIEVARLQPTRSDLMATRIRDLASKNPAVPASVVRYWMSETES